jgi:biopolymer transport protein ExbB
MNTFIERTVQLWIDGGWTMIPLGLVALMIYAAAVSLWFYFARRGHKGLSEADCKKLVEHPAQATGDLGEIVRYTQDRVKSLDQIQDRFAEVVASKIPEADRRAQFLNVLISSAPLLGLLGTVLGMLTTFHAISTGGGKTADMIAKGISEALITTEVGLLVALPGLMLAFFVKRQRNEYVAFLARLEKLTLNKYKPILHGSTRIFTRADFTDTRRPDAPAAKPAELTALVSAGA